MRNEASLIALGVWAHTYAGPTTSFLVNLPNASILLDTGVDPIGRMHDLGVLPTDCTHVYISHLHSDHCAGFPNLVFTRNMLGRTSTDPVAPLAVLGSKKVIDGCQTLLKLQYPERVFDLLWIPLDPGTPKEVAGDVTVSIALAVHPVECHACRVSMPGFSLGFTADTAPCPDHSEYFRSCTILLGEAFGTEGHVGSLVNQRGHSTAEDLGRLADASGTDWVVPFHFGPECADPSERSSLLRLAAGTRAMAIDPVAQPITVLSMLKVDAGHSPRTRQR